MIAGACSIMGLCCFDNTEDGFGRITVLYLIFSTFQRNGTADSCSKAGDCDHCGVGHNSGGDGDEEHKMA